MKLSEKMTLPIDGPLVKPIMTIGEGTVRAWQAEVCELESETAGMQEALEGHDRQMLLAKAKQLKGTDGEGWAIGELVERILDARHQRRVT